MTETPPPADPDSARAPDSPPMSAQPSQPVETVRGKRLARRKQLAALRNACFNMVSAGYTYAQIAESFGLPERTLRRHLARVIDERRLDAPERYIHLQVDRLTRALRAADDRVEHGDMKAVAPLIKLIGALDRYHGLDAAYRRELRPAPELEAPAAPLALAAPSQANVKLSEIDMQVLEKAPS